MVRWSDLQMVRSSGIFDTSDFAYQSHFDLTRIRHRIFDLLGDIPGDFVGDGIIHRLGIDDDAHFAAGLDGVGLPYAFETGGQLFEVLETLDVAFQRLAP